MRPLLLDSTAAHLTAALFDRLHDGRTGSAAHRPRCPGARARPRCAPARGAPQQSHPGGLARAARGLAGAASAHDVCRSRRRPALHGGRPVLPERPVQRRRLQPPRRRSCARRADDGEDAAGGRDRNRRASRWSSTHCRRSSIACCSRRLPRADAQFSVAEYCKAYRRAGNFPLRRRQIKLIGEVGRSARPLRAKADGAHGARDDAAAGAPRGHGSACRTSSSADSPRSAPCAERRRSCATIDERETHDHGVDRRRRVGRVSRSARIPALGPGTAARLTSGLVQQLGRAAP